ncbi:MAG: helix-turn-helix domain-containing protein [Chitinophagaceae bacterium]|nr:helix-turn-helix domain-containing protein [Chitinophagaceae bacterium]
MATFTPDTNNELFHLAIQLVNQSNRNIFLTGKAGTGKTTFLKYIRENSPKQMAVVAPTGVAAINAGGVTIHSFFQLPLSPFIPEARGTGFQAPGQEISNKHSLISRLRFNTDKKKVLQQLEILVIDEISMVRCDTLDAIDTILRHVRQRPHERFGGVQMLFIGDMLQLPPVIKEQEWNLLSDYYRGQYFFDSKVLEEEPPLYIEFDKIYRQSEERFISLLNQVRNNALDEDGMKILESRFQPSFRRSKQDGYIILTTHNNKASEINARQLGNLDTPLFSYQAEIVDEFSDRAFPADEVLHLKAGAQVMFIRNDAAEKGKRFFNGKIGTVSKLEENKIFVQCDGESSAIEVSKEKWENIRYTMNKATRQLDSDVLGSFTQYPLRLAWAITIHKSQGLTFEKAIIDAGEAFAPGQVYVALSRCTSLDGMVLQSRVRPSSLFSDARIVEFSQRSASSNQLQQELSFARKHYQLTILQSLFDFAQVINSCKETLEYILENSSSFNPESISWTQELLATLEKLQDTGKKFQLQLQYLFQQSESPENNQLLQERIRAGAQYYIAETGTLIQFIQRSPAITDSRLHSKEYNDSSKEVFAKLAEKKFLLEGISGKFDIEIFQQRKKQFILPAVSINAYAGASQKQTDSPHPVLHQQLRRIRENICSRKDLPIYIVAGTNTIDEMARYLPQTLVELRKISGFGDAKVDKYGQPFLDAIIAYCEERGLSSLINEKKPKKEKKQRTGPARKKGDTYAETLKLYTEGKSIIEIASERNLSRGTIEGHLAKFISSGEVKIEDIISPEKISLIETALEDFNGKSISPIKQQLGDDVSFGEIKLVMASLGITQDGSTD